MPQSRRRPAALERPKVLRADEDDAGRDQRLDHPRGRRQEVQGGQGEGHRVRHGESGHDLHQLGKGSAQEHQPDQEGQVIVAGEDVLDAESEEPAEPAPGRARPARLERGSLQLRHALRELVGSEVDAREMRVPRREGFEEPHSDGQLLDGKGADPPGEKRQPVLAVRLRGRARLQRAGLSRCLERE